jgi:hypothetical protein
MSFDRIFRLSETAGSGVYCSEQGPFVGQTQLLKRAGAEDGLLEWRPRGAFEIQHDLEETYGIPVDLTVKHKGISGVASALNKKDTARAQVSALLLQFPDPPTAPIAKSDLTGIAEFAKRLQASNLLSRDWDPGKHPRWPARTPDGVGGQFAPGGGDANPPESETATVPARVPVSLATSVAPNDGGNSGISFAATIGVLTRQIYQPRGWTACVYSNGVVLIFDGRITCPSAAIGTGG